MVFSIIVLASSRQSQKASSSFFSPRGTCLPRQVGFSVQVLRLQLLESVTLVDCYRKDCTGKSKIKQHHLVWFQSRVWRGRVGIRIIPFMHGREVHQWRRLLRARTFLSGLVLEMASSDLWSICSLSFRFAQKFYLMGMRDFVCVSMFSCACLVL